MVQSEFYLCKHFQLYSVGMQSLIELCASRAKIGTTHFKFI